MAEVVDVDLELIQEGTDFLLLEEVPDREPMQSRQSKIQSPVGDTTATTVAAVTTTSAESTPPVRPKTNIYSLAAETVISILEFLRATDLCAVSETDKTVFSSTRIKLAISYQLNFVSGRPPPPPPSLYHYVTSLTLSPSVPLSSPTT